MVPMTAPCQRGGIFCIRTKGPKGKEIRLLLRLALREKVYRLLKGGEGLDNNQQKAAWPGGKTLSQHYRAR